MIIKDFKEKFDDIAGEVTSDGVKVNSHDLIARVAIYDEEGNSYQIIRLEPGMLNCGCWDEVQIIIKKED